MDELRESSLLFSLESLLETERERVQREEREAQRRRDEELKRVAAAAQRRQLAAEQARQARERRIALEEQQDRLEQERAQAMRQAVVESARIEAEARTRLIEFQQAREHELALARIREGERSARHRLFVWLGGGSSVTLVAAAAFGYWGLLLPEHARQQQHLQSLLTVAEQKRALGEGELRTERAKNRELAGRLEQLAAVVPAPSAATPVPPMSPGKSSRHGAPRPPSASEPKRPCKDDGDPLNDCLRRR